LEHPGHPLNSCGIETDEMLSVPWKKGKAFIRTISMQLDPVLKDQDWVREKSGTGIAVATAWKVVNEIQ
jgi:anaerobic glycerol-3-phosphate dehydrogenase